MGPKNWDKNRLYIVIYLVFHLVFFEKDWFQIIWWPRKNAPSTNAEVTVASAAEARAAGRRMYADALRSKERLEAKRQEQQDLEALEDLNQRVSWCFEPVIKP